MAFDFKKEYKEFYLPRRTPQIISIPAANYIAIRGNGDPNTPNGTYQKAINMLYTVAYTLKMSYKTDYKIEGFFEYTVPPLEGFWQTDDPGNFNNTDKSKFNWISVIRLPEFITTKDFDWAVHHASVKKKTDFSAVEFLTLDEGICVQMMHVGPYDSESESLAIMETFVRENGYAFDLTAQRLHHEIYLSDPRRTDANKLKTVLRVPVRKIG